MITCGGGDEGGGEEGGYTGADGFPFGRISTVVLPPPPTLEPLFGSDCISANGGTGDERDGPIPRGPLGTGGI